MSLFRPAVKEQLKARVALDGPTGSGKTWTALQWATIIADGNPIGLIDTENRSAAFYAPSPGAEPERLNPWDPPYEFGHLPVEPPYDPRQLAKLIARAGDELAPDGVLVIDSLTHFWSGEGGTLDIVEDASNRGNSFTGWKEGTPAQRHLLDTIIHVPCHVIVTMRSKMEYVLVETEKNGRTIQVPTKVGMKPEQRAGIEYEFTVVADMDIEHRLTVSKSRADVVADVVVTSGRSHEPAQAFAAWLSSGAERASSEDVAKVVALFDSIADDEARKHVKAMFVAEHRKPDQLLASEVADAIAWVESKIDDLAPDEPTDESAEAS